MFSLKLNAQVQPVHALPCVDTLTPKIYFDSKYQIKADTVQVIVFNGKQVEYIPVIKITRYTSKNKVKDYSYRTIIDYNPRIFIKKSFILSEIND